MEREVGWRGWAGEGLRGRALVGEGTCEETGSSMLCSEHQGGPMLGEGRGQGGGRRGQPPQPQVPSGRTVPLVHPTPRQAARATRLSRHSALKVGGHLAVHQGRGLGRPPVPEAGASRGVASSAEGTRENPASCLDSSTTGGVGVGVGGEGGSTGGWGYRGLRRGAEAPGAAGAAARGGARSERQGRRGRPVAPAAGEPQRHSRGTPGASPGTLTCRDRVRN